MLGEMPEWQYSPEYIGEALNKERLGGGCYFSLCAGGETLLHPNMPSLIKNLLKQGHFVNVTNNGTISKAFVENRTQRGFETVTFRVFSSLHRIEKKEYAGALCNERQ